MAENKHSNSMLVLWALVLPLLAIDPAMRISDYQIYLHPTLIFLLPIATAALAIRYGRRALWCLLSLLPFCLIIFPFDWTNFGMFSISIFSGPAILIFLYVVGLHFSKFRNSNVDWIQTTPRAPLPAWIVCIFLFLACFGFSLYFEQPTADWSVGMGISADITLPLLLFLLAVSSRVTSGLLIRSLVILCAGLFAYSLINSVVPEKYAELTGLGFAYEWEFTSSSSEQGGMEVVAKGATKSDGDLATSQLFRTNESLGNILDGSNFSASINLEARMVFTLSIALAAGFLGRLLAPLWNGVSLIDDKRSRYLVFAVVISLFVMPVLVSGWNYAAYLAEEKIQNYLEEQHVSEDSVFSLQFGYGADDDQYLIIQEADDEGLSLETIVVTASKREQTIQDVGLLHALSLMVLAGLGLFFGQASTRRILKVFAIAVIAGLGSYAFTVISVFFYGNRPGPELWANPILALLSSAIILAIGSAVGARMQFNTHAGSRHRVTVADRVKELSSDLTKLAGQARRLDVSATARTFIVTAAIPIIVLSTVSLYSEFASYRAYLSEVEAEDSWILFLLAIPVIFVPVITLLGFVFVDRLSRQDEPLLSGILATCYSALTLFFAGIFLFFVAAVGIDFFDLYPPRCSYYADDCNHSVTEFFDSIESLAQDIRSFSSFGAWASYSQLLIILLIPVFLSGRSILIERSLAGSTPRQVLMGMIHIPGFGRTLAFLTGLPSSHWRWSAFVRPSTWMFLTSRVFVYLGIAVAVNSDLVRYLRLEYDVLREFGSSNVSLWVIGGLLVLLGHVTFAVAKRMAASRIWKTGATELDAKPILFLRSFDDDQLTFSRPIWDLPGRWLDIWSFRRNVDELLVDEFAQFGPVIALGKPGEKKRKFGAQRHYASHEDWQEDVKQAARDAQAIIVATGDTPGLIWEYNLLKSHQYLDKTIFLFPPVSQRTERAQNTSKLFSSVFEQFDLAVAKEEAVLISVCPTSDGTKIWTSQNPMAPNYLVALRRFFTTLHS